MYNIYMAFYCPGSIKQIMPYFSSSRYNGSLVTRMVRLYTIKFKPLVCSLSGFSLFTNEKICIFMILDDLCFLSE
jgi:hypothetical protein